MAAADYHPALYHPRAVMNPGALAAIFLIHLTGPDNQQIELNPDGVVALRAPRGSEQQHFAPGVQCLVYTVDAKYIGVKETCSKVRELLEAADVPLPRPRPPDLGDKPK